MGDDGTAPAESPKLSANELETLGPNNDTARSIPLTSDRVPKNVEFAALTILAEMAGSTLTTWTTCRSSVSGLAASFNNVCATVGRDGSWARVQIFAGSIIVNLTVRRAGTIQAASIASPFSSITAASLYQQDHSTYENWWARSLVQRKPNDPKEGYPS